MSTLRQRWSSARQGWRWKCSVEDSSRELLPDLYEAVTEAEKNLEEVKVEDEVTDVICENCGRNMVVKYGPHGKFLACPGFPDCKNTKPYLEKIGVPCPKCGKEVILRKTKKGRKYYGCENNPECDFMSGRNRLPRNARSAAAICWKKAISWSARTSSAAM